MDSTTIIRAYQHAAGARRDGHLQEPPGLGPGRQGLHQQGQPDSSAPTGDQGMHPRKADQDAHRRARDRLKPSRRNSHRQT